MATRSSPRTMFPRGQTSKTATRVSTLCNTQIQPNRTAAARVKYHCPTAEKVYEDQAVGIVCYQDEHGDVICEGLDEGPRYSRWASRDTHQESLRAHRHVQTPDISLQTSNQTSCSPNVLCVNGLAAHAQDNKQ